MKTLLKLRKIPKFIRDLLFKRVIFVFQMGKVGSSSAFFAVREYLEEQDEGHGYWNKREIGNTVLIHRHMVSGLKGSYRRMVLWRARLGLPIKVICPIREPIARDVSAFFSFYLYKRKKKLRGLLADANLGELEELFLSDLQAPAVPRGSELYPGRTPVSLELV